MKLDPAAVGALMETVGHGNPMVKGVTDLLISALGDDVEQAGEQEKARQLRRLRAQDKLRRIQRVIQAHVRRNAFLAGALGACVCWGENARCRACGGEGRAGFFEPDPAAFAAIVAPLFEDRRELVEEYLESRLDTARAERGHSEWRQA
jgi:hypothetical protein